MADDTNILPRDQNNVPASGFESSTTPGLVLAGKIDEATGRILVNSTGGGSSPLTTKGDLYTFTTIDARLAVGTDGQALIADSSTATGIKWATLPGGGDALTTSPLSQFASTTSLQLKGVMSDETGSGSLVFATSPDLTTPDINAATADSLQAGTTSAGLLLKNNAGTTVASFGVGGASSTNIALIGATIVTGNISATNLSGTNTGDQTITLTGDVTGSGTGSFATTIAAGAVDIAMLSATGTPSASTFLRGDNTWATPSGSGTVTNTGTLTANSVVIGNGTSDVKVIAGITTDGTSQLNLGVNATTLGSIKLFGSTSGDVTIKPAAVAGTATVFQLPADNGTNGYVLQTNGSGVTSWVAGGGGGGGITVGTTTITSGTDGRIGYNNGGVYGESSSLFFDDTNLILNVGGGTITGYTPSSTTDAIWATKSTNSFFSGLNSQNASNGTTASSDIIAYNDLGTSYLNMGIASSGNTDPLYTSGQANSTYIYGYGEKMTIGTGTSGKSIQFITGGTLTANIRSVIDGNGKFTTYDNSLATTQSLTTGLVVENTTAATSGAQKISPAIKLSGNGWKTNSTAGSQPVTVGLWTLPVQGAANPTSSLIIGESINGGAFSNILVLSGSTSGIVFSKSNSGLAKIYPSNDGAGTETISGSGLFVGFNSGSSGSGVTATTVGSTGSFSTTSGLNRMLKVIGNFNPTSGSGSLTMIEAGSTVNQTGSTGAWRGININPTLTAYTDVRGHSMAVTSTISSATSPLLKAIDIQNTINHTGSVTSSVVDDVFINDVETSLTGTTHNFIRAQISGTDKFVVASGGNVTSAGSYTSAAPSGGTAQPWKFGAVASVTPTAQNRTIEVEINGTTYYITAKTTND